MPRARQCRECRAGVLIAARPPHDAGDVVGRDVAVRSVLSHQPCARPATPTRRDEARGASINGAKPVRGGIPLRALARPLTDRRETPRAPRGCARTR